MKFTRKSVALAALLVVILGGSTVYLLSHRGGSQPPSALKKVRLSVAPFQDTLLPIIGVKKGWYREEGLDVEIKLLPWYSGQEALASNSVDVGMGNETIVIGAHKNFPNNIYYYGWNTFDNGFAIMVRSNSGLKTATQFEAELHDPTRAAKAAVAQLKGKTIITTSRTDMEQVVSYAVRAAGLDFRKDVKIMDMEPDEGLAAFLSGAGDAYLGGIPQRTRALKAGHIELVSGPTLGPAPINGFCTTRQFATDHQDELLRLQRVMFRIIDYTNRNTDEAAAIICEELNKNTAANFTIEDFKRFWNHYEHYMANAKEAQAQILNPDGPNYWKRRWDDTNDYFVNSSKAIPSPVDAADAFWMEKSQKAYLEKYGN